MAELPSVARRFLRYTQIDTQSSETSETFPSTEKQKNLSQLLVGELRELGLDDAAIDEHGYVMATLPATVTAKVPVLGLIAHVDTSPEVSGENVRAQVRPGYDGGPIKLNDTYTLTPEQSPALRDHLGSSGSAEGEAR